MPDLNSAGQPVDDKSRALKRRKLELNISVLETDILRREIEIEEMQAEIERKHDAIVASRANVVSVRKELEDG